MAIELPEAELLPSEVLWQAVVAPQLLAAGEGDSVPTPDIFLCRSNDM